MDETRDHFLTEAMGQCWHDYDPDKGINTYSLEGFVCTKCGNFILGNYDFSTHEDFLRLWQWAKRRAELEALCLNYTESDFKDIEMRNRLADEIFAFLNK